MSAFSGSYCDRFRDLLPLQALGCPLGEDAPGLRDHLEGCAACRREVLEFQEGLSLLPHALEPVQPGAIVKQRLLRQFRDEAAGAPQAPILPLIPPTGRARSGMMNIPSAAPPPAQRSSAGSPLLMAASLCVVAGSLFLYARDHRRLRKLEGERAALTQQVHDLLASSKTTEQTLTQVQQEAQFLHARSVQLVTLQPPGTPAGDESQQAVGHILWDRDHRAWLFLAFQLPPPPPDRDYQLWFMVKGQEAPQPVSAGLVPISATGDVTANIQVPGEIGDVVAAALTLEPKGGSDKPTSEPLLVGQI